MCLVTLGFAIGDLECPTPCPHNDGRTSNITAYGPNVEGCRCDSHCSFFQDCCLGSTPLNSTSQDGSYSNSNTSLWSCHSLFPASMVGIEPFSPDQVGVYAISKCPHTWPAVAWDLGLSTEESILVEEVCVAPNTALPPASDAVSGHVYRNEYCALCHEVPLLALWRHTRLCSVDILDAISDQLKLPLASLEENCGTCIYSSPPPLYSDTVPDIAPRSCTPAIGSCPDFSESLQLGLDVLPPSAQDYQELVDNCTGQTEYVRGFSVAYDSEVVFKNPNCATCNAFLASRGLQCFTFDLPGFPACSVLDDQVEIVFDAAQGTAQVFNRSESILRDIAIDVSCAPGQVFDVVTGECRTVSCSLFQNSSGFSCTIVGLPVDMQNGSNQSSEFECAQELVLDNPLLLLRVSETTFYYLPLLSLVFVTYTNALGFPVACLDTAIPITLRFLQVLKALNASTFLVVVPSILVLALIIFVYTYPVVMRSFYGMVVANLAIASLLADLALLLSYSGAYLSRSQSLCFSAGVLEHSLGLAQLMWTTLLACTLAVRCYRKAYSISRGISLRVLILYYAVGWCLPLVITSFEVTFAYAVNSFGDLGSCFQITSFWNSFLLYVIPSLVSIVVGAVVLPSVYFHIHKMAFDMTTKDKVRFVLMCILIAIMSASFIVTVAGLYVASIFANVIVSFTRLLLIVVRSVYLAAMLLLVKKLPKALKRPCASLLPPNAVQPASLEVVEMANISVSGDASRKLQLDEFADQLTNPPRSAQERECSAQELESIEIEQTSV